MYEFHLSYYDPFPCLKHFATSDWNDVLAILRKYNCVHVHIHNSIRNRFMCPFCTKD